MAGAPLRPYAWGFKGSTYTDTKTWQVQGQDGERRTAAAAACLPSQQEGLQWQSHRRQALCQSDSEHRWPQPSTEQPQPSREQPNRGVYNACVLVFVMHACLCLCRLLQRAASSSDCPPLLAPGPGGEPCLRN